ncbi:MAG: hypothetical protein V3V41_00935 [Candidatus Heimdallarchaeota archaeon]
MYKPPKNVIDFWKDIYNEDAPKIILTSTRRRRNSYFETLYGIPIIRTGSFIVKGEVVNVKSN